MSDLALDTGAAQSPKRRQILDAATELFVAQGYGAVSMDAVARVAGVSKATLYAHFESKDRLFATIIEDACRTNILDASMLPDPATDLREALLAIALRMLRFIVAARSIAIHRVVIAESGRFPELGRAFYDHGPARVRAVLATWLAARDADGRLNVQKPAVAAEQFIGLLRSSVFVRATLGMAPAEDEIEQTAVEAVATFLRAFASPVYSPSGPYSPAD